MTRPSGETKDPLLLPKHSAFLKMFQPGRARGELVPLLQTLGRNRVEQPHPFISQQLAARREERDRTEQERHRTFMDRETHGLSQYEIWSFGKSFMSGGGTLFPHAASSGNLGGRFFSCLIH